MTEQTLTPTEVDEVAARLKQSNDDRRAERLTREITRAHDWRVQVWAQSETRIRAKVAEMEAMGRTAPVLYEPDFESAESLQHYSDMTLPKR